MNQHSPEPPYTELPPPQPARRRRRGGCCGCLAGGLVALLLGVALFYGGWRYGDRLFERDPLEGLAPVPQLPRPTPTPEPDEPPADEQESGSILDRIRGRVADIQDEWETLQESGEIEERLDTLRREIEQRSESAGESLRENWQEALEKSEELLEQAREKSRQAPEEAQDLIDMLKKLREEEAPPGPTPTPQDYAI